MGKQTGIEWADHTFNPWRGCSKVSLGCDNCYAERGAGRNPKVLGVWGEGAHRAVAAEAYWAKPRAWEAEARAAGERRRVFCASLADVFEDREDLEEHRFRLFKLIEETPGLDWLILTKRPGFAGHWLYSYYDKRDMPWLNNLWLGTSVESNAVRVRIEELIEAPANTRFLSCEPLIGPLDLRERCSACSGIGRVYGPAWTFDDSWPCSRCDGSGASRAGPYGVDWVIVGGETGAKARPMAKGWAATLRDQCQGAGSPFFFKQWGEFGEEGERVGKKGSGRELDGRTWSEFPA